MLNSLEHTVSKILLGGLRAPFEISRKMSLFRNRFAVRLFCTQMSKVGKMVDIPLNMCGTRTSTASTLKTVDTFCRKTWIKVMHSAFMIL